MTTDELRNIVAHIVIGFARKDEAESGINSAKPFVLKATWDSSSGEYSIADYDSAALHTAVNGGRVALLKFENGSLADYTLVYVDSNSASDTFGGVSDGTLFSANLSPLNGAVVIDTYNVADIGVIRSGAALGATAYQKPDGGIPKGDLSSAVQSSLSKADSALQSHQDLSSYATGAEYDSASKRIYLKHGSNRLTDAYVDATAFIKDGMVDNVTINSGYLVITFNTDSGKEPISLALTDIFNASNYYTKTDIDNAGYLTSETDPTVPSHVKSITQANIASWSGKQDAIGDLADIRSGAGKGATAYQKPSGGIPKSDLASAVQTSLGKADTALQSFTESDPVFAASAAHGISSSDISNWNSKTSNVGTITGIKMNGASKGTSGVVDLGTVLTSFTESDPTVPSWAKQSTKPTYNGGEVKYTGTTGNVVTNNTTLNVAVQALDTAVNNRLKYVLLSQAEYDSLVTKDSGTLYLIEGTKYTITLTGTGVSGITNISVNGESKTTSDFPLEVDEGSSFGFKTLNSFITTVTMGGTDITSSVKTEQSVYYVYDITNITGDIVVSIYYQIGGGGSSD